MKKNRKFSRALALMAALMLTCSCLILPTAAEAGINDLAGNKTETITGKTIYINNGDEKPIRELQIAGKTYQASTPSTEAPAAIQSVKAGTEILITGKNLCDIGTTTFTGTKQITLTNPIPAGTYTFSADFSNDSEKYKSASVFFFYEKTEPAKKQLNISEVKKSQTITFDRPVKIINFYSSNTSANSQNTTATYSNIQIEPGSKATAYEPYTLQTTLTVPYDLYEGDIWHPLEGVFEKRNGVIASYNGESIPGSYVSTTGTLSTGATVVYKLNDPEYINTTTIEAFNVGKYTSIFQKTIEQTGTLSAAYKAEILPVEPPKLAGAMQETVSILTGGIRSLAAGIGTGLGNLTASIFIKTSAEGTILGLTTFGSTIIIFAGVALAISLSKYITGWVTRLGGD